MRIIARFLVVTVATFATVAKAAPIELDCAEDGSPDRHWLVTLNVDTGTGSLVFKSDGQVMAANVPTAFTPNEARVKQASDFDFVVDRTTLKWRHELVSLVPAAVMQSGQCAIVKVAHRKF